MSGTPASAAPPPDLEPTSADALAPLAATAWTLEPPARPELKGLMRSEAALLLDGLLVRVARGRGALEVAIGDGLASLGEGDRALRLGFARLGDYALHRLGIAASTAEKMARLARALRATPLLRAAVWSGEVTARKAEAVVQVARGDAEPFWVARASSSTVRALEAAVADANPAGGPPEEEAWERVAVGAAPEVQACLDEALAVAGQLLGGGAPRWQRVEAICAEFLSEFPEPPPEPASPLSWGTGPHGGTALDGTPERSLDGVKAWLEREWREWEFLERIGPVPAPGASDAGARGAGPPDRTDPFALDADLRRLAALRARWDEVFGHLAFLVRYCGLWRDMQFASFGHYCSERLGVGARTVGQRIALERRLYDLPPLRAALRDGRISYEQARLVARHATGADVEDWIARAGATTCVALAREVEDLDGAQMCAEGVLRLRLPSRVSALLEAAFRAARASASRFLTPEECLLAVAVHFLAVWGPRKRRRVIDRDRGRCQVPGCSRPAVQSHHILFRSRGGGDEKENQTSMCLPHHLHCLHLGWLRVTGRAPGGLRWELGVRRGRPPLEVWAPGSAAA